MYSIQIQITDKTTPDELLSLADMLTSRADMDPKKKDPVVRHMPVPVTKPELDNRPQTLKPFDELSDNAFVRLPTVRQLFGGVTAATIYRWANDGRIPKSRKISDGISAWSVRELRECIANKLK